MKEGDRITSAQAKRSGRKKKVYQSESVIERVPEIVVVWQWWWEGEKEERNGSYVMWWGKDEVARLAIKKEKRESCKEKWIIAVRYVMGFLSLTF